MKKDIMGKEIRLLDHGFVRVVDVMGEDDDIVQAARVSYATGTKVVRDNKRLIRYLLRNMHTSPFEMCEIKFHVKLPIFVARQWIRHRTANVNEVSGRYSEIVDEFYIPSPDAVNPQSKNNKQARSIGSKLPPEVESAFLKTLRDDCETIHSHYEGFLGKTKDLENPNSEEKVGVARELARIGLSLNYYTEWYWKIDLKNLLHFIKLRNHAHAQYEIRVYAEAIAEIVKEWLPITYEAFEDYILNAFTLSRQAIEALKNTVDLVRLESELKKDSSLSEREVAEMLELFSKK